MPGGTSGVLRSLGLFVAADSPVDPVYFGYGRAAVDSQSFYFFLGRPP